MKKIAVVCVVAVMVFCAVAGAQTPSDAEMPDPVVAVAEIANLTEFANTLQTTAPRIHPSFANVPPVAQLMAMSVLKTTNPQSVDLSSPVQWVVLEPPLHVRPVTLFSLKDVDAYWQSLYPALQETEVRENVHVFQEQAGMFGPGGAGAGTKPLCIGVAGKKAALGRDFDTVRAVLDMLEAGNLHGERVFAEQAGAVVRLKKLLDGLKDVGQNPFALWRSKMSQMPLSPEQLRAQEFAVDMYQNFANQIEMLSFRLTLAEQDVLLFSGLLPVEGSGIAQYFDSVPSGRPTAQRLLSGDADMAMVFKNGDWGPMMEWYGQAIEKMVGEQEGGAELTDRIKQMMQEWVGIIAGEVSASVSFTPNGQMMLTEFAEIKDPQEARRQIREFTDTPPDFAKLGTTPGFKQEFEGSAVAETYKGVDIARWVFTYEMDPSAQGMDPQAAQAAQAMMDSLFGGPMEIYMAVVGDYYTVTFGADALEHLKSIIDRGTAVGDASGNFAEIVGSLPVNSVAGGYVKTVDMVRWIITFLQGFGPMAQMAPLLQQLRFQDAPPCTFDAVLEESGLLEQRARMPLQTLSSIVAPFMQMAMQMQGPPAAQPAPPME